MSVTRIFFKIATTFVILGVLGQFGYVVLSTFSEDFKKYDEIPGNSREISITFNPLHKPPPNMSIIGGTLRSEL